MKIKTKKNKAITIHSDSRSSLIETQVISKIKHWTKAHEMDQKRNSQNSAFRFLKIVELLAAEFKSKKNNSCPGLVFVLDKSDTEYEQNFRSEIQAIINKWSLGWQKETLLSSQKDSFYFQTEIGPIWFLIYKQKKTSHDNFFTESGYAWARENIGGLISHFKIHGINEAYFYFDKKSPEILTGGCVGMEMAAYSYKDVTQSGALKNKNPEIFCNYFDPVIIHDAILRSRAINSSRHLVNLPPNKLGPEDFSELIKKIKFAAGTKVEVWGAEKLKQERMNLHLAVGQGSDQESQLVHIHIPAVKSKKVENKDKVKNIAFVGKGITFDTGGLDIKPSSGMRLMKKDMGGAACLVGLAQYASHKGFNHNIDIYLALAENAIDAKSFRPSDVISARNGLNVEIDNTDAEGRLVLADALDVAVTSMNNPDYVIDVATLTGAIKVALGADVAGLFSNDDELANMLTKASVLAGDLCWRMPLVDKYFSGMNSSFADFKNSADGFGGAITAALFLQKFTAAKKWAHLDIYAWNDKTTGALSFSGGNGQGVQLLIDFLNSNF